MKSKRYKKFAQRGRLIAVLFLVVLTSCHSKHPSQVPESGGSLHPYAGAMAPDDGQWVRATKNYANTRYSSLDQINAGNVAQLKPAWTFSKARV